MNKANSVLIRIIFVITLASVIYLLAGCITNPNIPQSINSKISYKGQIGDQKMGINDKKELILQKENDASDELRIQKAVNMRLQDDFNSEAFGLNQCRNELSDPRLGGNSEVPPINEIDNMKAPTEIREEIGITDDGEIKVVRKSFFLEELRNERKYETSLRKMIQVVSKHKEGCEYKMAIARRKAGLPSSRYQGKGYFTQDGVWVQTMEHEHSLDDAFEIQAKAKKRSEPSKEVANAD